MKKVLLAFDGTNFSQGSLEFARQLNEKSPIHLSGLFLPLINYSSLWSYSGGGKDGSVFIPLLEDQDATVVQNNILKFEEFCDQNKVSYEVQKEFFDFPLPELKAATRYADLLILSSEKFYEQAGVNSLNEYFKEALREVECSVIIIPETFSFPIHNILAYDGKEQSVYAIKQFAYLFPEMKSNNTSLVYANRSETDVVPHQAEILQLATSHYPNFHLSNPEINSKSQFTTLIENITSGILVSGAFGRSGLARLFHTSFVSNVIKDHRLPVFIAHKIV